MTVNPLLWLHFRLTGAWCTNLLIALVYASLAIVGATVSYRMAGTTAPPGAVSKVWLGIVTAAQGLFLLLIGPGAIRKAILQDFQTGMIESHRLSPMSGFRIVVGYMVGPPVQAFWLAGTGLVLGSYFAVDIAVNLSPLVVPGWYGFQLCVMCVALMVSSAVVLIALSTSGKLNVVGLMIPAAIFGGWAALQFVPGLALATGVLGAGDLILALFQGGPTGISGDARGVALAALLQLAFTAMFLRAACRKVRAPERAMFSIPLGLLLAVVWAGALVAGMALMPSDHWLISDFDNPNAAQIICSAATLMIVALFPLLAAANERFRLERAVAFGVVVSRARMLLAVAMPALLAGLGLATMVLMYRWTPLGRMPFATSADTFRQAFTTWPPLLAMLLALGLSFWTDLVLLFWIVARGMRVLRMVLILTVLLKAGPLLMALCITGVWEALDQPLNFTETQIAGFSPVGTLMMCMCEGGNPWPGLVGQLGLAGLATWLAWRTRRWLRRMAGSE
ncbi:MAG: hypothetical protein ABIG44_13285 [Planctomycetota bacterium]